MIVIPLPDNFKYQLHAPPKGVWSLGFIVLVKLVNQAYVEGVYVQEFELI